MTKYYPDRHAAQDAATAIKEADDRILWAKVELEPYNGWAVVIAAKPRDLTDLEQLGYEVDNNGRRTKDSAKRRPTPLDKPRAPGDPGAAPRGGVTARVWAICEEQGGDRAKIMAACSAEGINKATAGTQYAKWKRSKQ